MSKIDADVLIAGAGIGGLTLALKLFERGISCRVYEAVSDIRAVGAGINLLPHAVKELEQLGLLPALDRVGIRTRDASYFDRFGHHIYTEPAGLAAGYQWPQFSIHRGDLQLLLLEAVKARLGDDAVLTGHRCVGIEQGADTVTLRFEDPQGHALPPAVGRVAVGSDGIKSTFRQHLYPGEGEPVYSGLTIWRGTVPYKPFLGGANTVRIGWMPVGKLMVYPIRDRIDEQGRQLLNWVATLERPRPSHYDWNRPARHDEFIDTYKDWRFDWLDVPDLLASTEQPLVFPMVDRNPVPTWTQGRITLLGDAAHPMYPRGSNGAGQSILDAKFLALQLGTLGTTPQALQAYDQVRVAETAKVVLMNRKNPPDAILREVYERTGDKPFARIDDVISPEEIRALSDGYKKVAGFHQAQINEPA